MSDHNNIYNIMGKLNALTPKEEPVAQPKQKHYDTVEARGSVLEGVGAVEAKLNKQFAEGAFDNVNPRVEKPTIPGTDKKAKSAYYPPEKPPVKKLDKPTDKFDKVTKEGEEQVTEKARNKYAIGMAAAKKQAGITKKHATGLPKSVITKGHEIAKSINESFNFADMMKETGTTVKEMLAELQDEIKTFEQTGHCGDKLEAFLKVHNHGKNRLMGEAVPKGPSFAPQDAMALDKAKPFEPSRVQGKPGMMDKAAAAIGKGVNKALTTLGHGSDDELLADLRKKSTMEEDESLNELAKLAGLTVKESFVDEADMEEGNRFTGGLEDDDIAIGDKIPGTNAVKQVDIDEGGVCSGCGMTECECDHEMGELPGMSDGKINVSTNFDSDGNKNVNINAEGGAADQLMDMLKLAGLEGGMDAGSEPAHMDEPEVIAVGGDELGGGEEGVEEEYANEPEEEYGSIDNALGVGGDGDIAGKAHRNFGGLGDNRMSQQPSTPQLPVKESVLSLEAELAAEYESIKKSV